MLMTENEFECKNAQSRKLVRVVIYIRRSLFAIKGKSHRMKCKVDEVLNLDFFCSVSKPITSIHLRVHTKTDNSPKTDEN